ncbi:MAG: nicotinate-nucleotide adenylyltransferase [Enterococcus sp.]
MVQEKVLVDVEAVQLETTKRKQIGLLGGNFNPIHYTHLIMADQVGQALGLDRVDLMPEYLPPHVDTKTTIPAKHRLKMLELAIQDNDLLGIETCELERKGKSFTFETMQALTQKYPDTDYYFIIGGDMVDYLPKWHKIEELLQLVTFVGIKRPEFPVVSPYPILWVDAPVSDVSSSMIRNKINQGCSVNYLLPKAVQEYIFNEGLYLGEV